MNGRWESGRRNPKYGDLKPQYNRGDKMKLFCDNCSNETQFVRIEEKHTQVDEHGNNGIILESSLDFCCDVCRWSARQEEYFPPSTNLKLIQGGKGMEEVLQ